MTHLHTPTPHLPVFLSSSNNYVTPLLAVGDYGAICANPLLHDIKRCGRGLGRGFVTGDPGVILCVCGGGEGVFTLYREARKVTESKDEGVGDGDDADISCVQVTGEGVGAGGGSSLRSHVSVQWI